MRIRGGVVDSGNFDITGGTVLLRHPFRLSGCFWRYTPFFFKMMVSL